MGTPGTVIGYVREGDVARVDGVLGDRGYKEGVEKMEYFISLSDIIMSCCESS